MEYKEKGFENVKTLMMSMVADIEEMKSKADDESNKYMCYSMFMDDARLHLIDAIDKYYEDNDVDGMLNDAYEYLKWEVDNDDRIKGINRYRDFMVRCRNKVNGWIRERKYSCNSNDEKEFICEEIMRLSEKLCNEIRDSFALMASYNKQGYENEYDIAYAQYIGAKEIIDYVELDFSIKRGERAIKLFSRIENELDVACIQYDDEWEERMKEEYVKMFNRYVEYIKDIKRRCIEKFPDSADIQ